VSREVVAFTFVGGLGDMFVKMFLYDTYAYLETVTQPVDILAFSSNPYAAELFDFHPNRKNLCIHTMQQHPEFQKKYFSKFSGGEEEQRIYGKQFLIKLLGKDYKLRTDKVLPSDLRLNFYLSPSEKEKLPFYQSSPYAIVQPFASSQPKDIPSRILIDILNALAENGLNVYLPIRNNIRVSYSREIFHARQFLEKNIFPKVNKKNQMHVVEESVPMVIQMISGAAFFVGPDSAFVKAAWHYHKPNILLLPAALLQRPSNQLQMNKKIGIYFGAKSDLNWTRTFELFESDQLRIFIKKITNSSALQK